MYFLVISSVNKLHSLTATEDNVAWVGFLTVLLHGCVPHKRHAGFLAQTISCEKREKLIFWLQQIIIFVINIIIILKFLFKTRNLCTFIIFFCIFAKGFHFIYIDSNKFHGLQFKIVKIYLVLKHRGHPEKSSVFYLFIDWFSSLGEALFPV